MLTPALILIAFDIACHLLLALLHLMQHLPLPPMSHRARETLAGLAYAGMAVVLFVGAIVLAHGY